MKRPIFVIGLTFLLISAVNISLSGTARLILGAVILLCLLAVMKKKQLRKYRALPVILAVCLISVLWVSAYTELTVSPADNMQGKTARLTGKLCELPYVSYGRYYYEIEADKLTGTDSSVLTHTKILVSSAKPLSLEPYDTLTATVSIHPETPFYRKVKGIMLTASVKEDDSVQITPETDKPLYYYFLMLRSRIGYQNGSTHYFLRLTLNFCRRFFLAKRQGFHHRSKTICRMPDCRISWWFQDCI